MSDNKTPLDERLKLYERSDYFLGRGWAFPPSFGRDLRAASLVYGDEDISQSLWLILSTNPGERVADLNFGCGLNSFVFEQINATVIAQLQVVVKRAVLFYEPRVTLHKVDVQQDPEERAKLLITLDYSVISTNTRTNLVYPFYLQEATNHEV